MKDTQKLAVLIPHYNQRAQLEQSLRSITFAEPLSVIIVDDGSDKNNRPDGLWLQSLDTTFSIEVVRLEKNSGITAALNAGLHVIFEKIGCPYIARMDCGDYNMSDRLDTQYAFMERNADIALCGTWATVVNDEHKPLYSLSPPASHQEIVRTMQSGNCFVHPSVMMRTEVARKIGYYPDEFPAAEDYAYFFKFVNQYTTANIPLTLVMKMRDTKSISYRKRKEQLVSRLKIIVKNFRFMPQSFWGISKTIALLVTPTALVEWMKEKFPA